MKEKKKKNKINDSQNGYTSKAHIEVYNTNTKPTKSKSLSFSLIDLFVVGLFCLLDIALLGIYIFKLFYDITLMGDWLYLIIGIAFIVVSNVGSLLGVNKFADGDEVLKLFFSGIFSPIVIVLGTPLNSMSESVLCSNIGIALEVIGALCTVIPFGILLISYLKNKKKNN